MKVITLSAQRSGCLYTQETYLVTHFCLRLSRPQGQSESRRTKSLKASGFMFLSRCIVSRIEELNWIINATILRYSGEHVALYYNRSFLSLSFELSLYIPLSQALKQWFLNGGVPRACKIPFMRMRDTSAFIINTPQMYVCKIHTSLPEVEITSLAHIRTNFRRCLSASHDKRTAVWKFSLFSNITHCQWQ
jgi:hypothetical protein